MSTIFSNRTKKINRKGCKGLRKGRKDLQSVYTTTYFLCR
jgi:hypothetical protein